MIKSFIERFNRLTLLEILYPVIILIAFFWVYNYTFNTNLNLGGDNAAYYLLGKALSQGEGYVALQTSNHHAVTHFPPGYPLLISIEMFLFSDSITAVKYLNGFFLLFSALTLFWMVNFFSKNTHLALVSSLFIFANYHLLQYSSIMMSEIPYLFLTLLVLYQLTKIDLSEVWYTNKRFLITVLLVVFAFHVRTLGISLVAAVVLYILTQKKWAYASVTVLCFVLLSTPWQLRNRQYSENSYVKQLLLKNPYHPDNGLVDFSGFLHRIGENITRYTTKEIPHGLMPFYSVDYKAEASLTDWLVGISVLLLIITGLIFIRNAKHRNLLLFYILGTAGILAVWPEVWNGIRFFLPLIPVFIFLILNTAYYAINFVLQKFNLHLPQTALLLLLGVFFYSGTIQVLHAQKKADYLDGWKNYFQMANYVKRELPDSAVVICRKPSLFYLKADRHVANYRYTADEEEFLAYFNEHNITHVVVDQLGYSSTGKYLIPIVQKHPDKFPVIQHLKEPDTYLCEYKKDNGYHGEWKDGKKDGFGTYRYANGTSYEGTWVNDLREGTGTFTFTTGDQYIGEWKNNVREGKGTLVTQNGTYTGDWKNDRFWGKGQYQWKNGYQYSGEWKDGKRAGRGTFKQNGTVVYSGIWENDRPKP